MKKKGFTLVELVVVIALIAILAVTLAPRLRDQIAKANDAKAIATLGALRTLSEVYYADFQEVPGTVDEDNPGIPGATDDGNIITLLYPDLDNSAKTIFDDDSTSTNPILTIGGSRPEVKGTVKYGGTVSITFEKPAAADEILVKDDIYIWFEDGSVEGDSTTSNAFDTKGKNWGTY